MKKACLTILIFLLVFSLMLGGCTEQSSSQSDDTNKLPSAVRIYPVVLVDTTNYADSAYVICFCEGKTVKTLDAYTYDGKPLRDFIGQDDALTQSSVLDLSQKIKLIDNMGALTEIQPVSVQCTERVIDETLLLNVAVEPSLTDASRFYIGTYSEIDIFPGEITYQDNAVQVDLDGNGQLDRIDCAFAPTTTYYEEKMDYTVSVNRNGVGYPLVEENYIPLEREDLAIFVTDLNQDGEHEILVYANGMSQFGHLTVYTFSDNQYSIMLQYAVDCEP